MRSKLHPPRGFTYLLPAIVTLSVSMTAASADRYETCLKSPREVSVRLETAAGDIDLKLHGARAPLTVCNFLRYVQAGLFDGGSFARTVRPANQQRNRVPISVIQGDIRAGTGAPYPPIELERTTQTRLRHRNGTVSMARGAPDSATSGFFVCVDDQPELDFNGKRNPDGQGFAAFGEVTRGMAVVKRIWMSPAAGETLTPPIPIVRAWVLPR